MRSKILLVVAFLTVVLLVLPVAQAATYIIEHSKPVYKTYVIEHGTHIAQAKTYAGEYDTFEYNARAYSLDSGCSNEDYHKAKIEHYLDELERYDDLNDNRFGRFLDQLRFHLREYMDLVK